MKRKLRALIERVFGYRFAFDLCKPSAGTLQGDLMGEITRYLAVKTMATESQITSFIMIGGPDWVRLVRACERLSNGERYTRIRNDLLQGKF